MTDEASFLERIQANPQDLFLRLVYADWLEEREDPRSEYLRVDGQLQRLLGSLSPNNSGVEPKIRQLRARLKKLGKALDPAWVAIFDALRPTIYRCRACQKIISAKEAIDTNPVNYTKMKTTRYCRPCYEDAVRNQLTRGSNSSGSYGGFDQSYHGGARDDV
jgi:uncharacterized protein (TIGR02996 family)